MLGSTRVRQPHTSTRAPRKKPQFQPAKRPRQARAQATYESILDAAARLLASQGYAAFTTNQVAELAGVSIGSLYEYFPRKEVIVAEVARRTVREMLADLAREHERMLARGIEQGLRAWVRAMFAVVEARRPLVRALWRDVPFLREIDEVRDLLEAFLAIARQGHVDVKSPVVAANLEAATYLLTVMVSHAVVESVVARPSHLPMENLEDTLADMLAALLVRTDG